MNEFTGKVALITGAGRGMGREIGSAFAALGAAVAANDINPINLDETVEQITRRGGKARGFVFDIAKRMPVEAMVTQVWDHFGRIDYLVNHASIKPDAFILDMDEWEFHRTLDVNLGGAFFCVQQAGRVMRQQGGGAIVNLLSITMPPTAQKGYSAYAASQAGLVGLTLAAAVELSKFGIRLNAVCHPTPEPGMIDVRKLGPDDLTRWQAAYPDLQAGGYSNLTRLVLFLCSEESRSLVGQVLALSLEK